MLTYESDGNHFGSSTTMSTSPLTNKPDVIEPSRRQSHIWIVTGPAGCGKTTVAKHLAQTLDLSYIEGDEFHTEENIKKMASGIPLTDIDRWDWLIRLRQESMQQLRDGALGVVLTCSALKRKYRDVIRIAAYPPADVAVHFIYLKAAQDVLVGRVMARQGHYMKESMVRSQFQSLEEPQPDELDTLTVDVSGSMLEVERLVIAAVQTVQPVASTGPAAPAVS